MRRFIGLDIGRARDHSALAVVEARGQEPVMYHIVHLDQQPLGTRYREVVRWVEETLDRFPHSPLVVDVGEAGASVLELLRECNLDAVGVRITAGEHESRDLHGTFHVAKPVLSGHLDVVMNARRLRAEPVDQLWADVLQRQMRAFTRKQTPEGHARFESRTEAVHDDLVTAVMLALWYAEHHAGTPIVSDFFPAQHVARESLEAMPGVGMPIIRGWRLDPPVACVALQIWDGGRSIQVLFEWPPLADVDIATLRGMVLTNSAVLFPDFLCHDYVSPNAFERLSGSAGQKSLSDQLRPEILPRRGEGAFVAQEKVLRERLTTYHGDHAAFQVDPRCSAIIRALGGGCVFMESQGRVLGVPRNDEYWAILDALTVALAAPMVTMSAAERRRIAGPRVLQPE
jgi:hypothetical protein